MSELRIVPLAPEYWDHFEHLLGPNGATGGCWCMWWRRPRDEFRAGRGAANRDGYRDIVAKGPPPGLLAFDGDEAVGWCQVCPRQDLPGLDRSPQLKPIDATPVWALSCFFVDRRARGRGVATALIKAALDRAREAGAPALEAYPWDTSERKLAASVFTGIASSFTKLGFETIARRAPHRPVMRYTFNRQVAS
jgi:GNAT superfamily N-acetyltransferase